MILSPSPSLSLLLSLSLTLSLSLPCPFAAFCTSVPTRGIRCALTNIISYINNNHWHQPPSMDTCWAMDLSPCQHQAGEAFPLGGDPPLWDVLIKECYWRFWFKTDKESSGEGCDRQEGAYHNTNGNNSRKPSVVFYCWELRSRIG